MLYFRNVEDDIMKKKQKLKPEEQVLAIGKYLTQDTHDIQDLLDPDEEDIDYELREKAGEVVQPLDYSKRIRALIGQLPETIVNTIEEYGHETPGLKGVTYKYPHEVYSLRKWYDGVYSLLPLIIKDKFDTLEEYKNKAYEFIPNQDEYTVDDVQGAFDGFYERIFHAIKGSSQDFEKALYTEELDKHDLEKMYV